MILLTIQAQEKGAQGDFQGQISLFQVLSFLHKQAPLNRVNMFLQMKQFPKPKTRDRYPQPVLPLLLRLLKTLRFLLFLLLNLQQLCTLCLRHFTQHLMHHGPVLLGTVATDVSLLMAGEAQAL